MKIGLLVLFGIFGLLVITSAFIINQIALNTCEEAELKPVRYELSGLFKNYKTAIVTTPVLADNYEMVCIKYLDSDYFNPLSNFEKIVELNRGEKQQSTS